MLDVKTRSRVVHNFVIDVGIKVGNPNSTVGQNLEVTPSKLASK